MTNKDTVIAEFMPKSGIFWLDPTNGTTLIDRVNHEQLQYHKSYDWLMKVIDVIEGLGFYYHFSKNLLDNNYYCSYVNRDCSPVSYSLIAGRDRFESLYESVVTFIEYYNNL